MSKTIRLPVIHNPNPNAIGLDIKKIQVLPHASMALICGKCSAEIVRIVSLDHLRNGLEQARGAFTVTCPVCTSLLHLPDVPQPHPSFREPTRKDIKVWRYMDLAKFVSVLQNNGLFFPKASLLGDPFEGSTPRMNRTMWELIKQYRKTAPEIPPFSHFKDLTDDQITTIIEGSSIHRREMTDRFLVNSWHMNEHESAAMWKIYTATQEAICIQSTYKKLRLLMPEWVHIGEFNYIDYDKQVIIKNNTFNFIMKKRHSFNYERELRAVAWSVEWILSSTDLQDNVKASGIWVPADLDVLIENLYISPTSPSWFAEAVGLLVKKYGFSFPVRQSLLSSSPIY
jgi:hypothetical protein